MEAEDKQRVGLHKAVVRLFELAGLGRPALILTYTLPKDRKDVHWISNVPRAQAIAMLRELATKMEAQQN